MSKGNLIYQAKSRLIKWSKDYVIKDSHGYDTDCLVAKMKQLNMYINSLERYETSSNFEIKNCQLYLNGKKVILSEKNNYICNEEQEQTNQVLDIYTNCLTEDQICEVAKKVMCMINS